MLLLFLLLIGLILIVYSGYKFLTLHYDYFEKQGLKYQRPIVGLGSSGWLFQKISLSDYVLKVYNEFSNEKIFGQFDFRQPVFFIRDLELVKSICIKNFDHFDQHRVVIDNETDDLFGSMLTAMMGQKWRDMRSSLSPAFTGSKMRQMFELVSTCGKDFSNFLKTENDAKGPQEYDMKDIFTRYTTDVIATCAFGLQCDSFNNPNNEFLLFGRSFADFQKPLFLMKFFIITLFPKLAKLSGMKIMSESTKKTFYQLIIETINSREKSGIVRPDMINLLIQLKAGKLKKTTGSSDELSLEKNEIAAANEIDSENGKIKTVWTDNELIAQCFIFFLAGYDTSSTCMLFTAYELAMNPEIQDKLYEEIVQTKEILNGKLLTYDFLQKMEYLDMVIAETLRKWPPATVTDRLCVKDFYYDDGEGCKFIIEKGRLIAIPIHAFHHDAKFFPNPEKFDPERFSPDNKMDNNFEAFMPFGIGPRNCIGSRFALMETKAVLFYILQNFKLEIGEKTQVPIKLSKGLVGLIPEKKIFLRFTPRHNE